MSQFLNFDEQYGEELLAALAPEGELWGTRGGTRPRPPARGQAPRAQSRATAGSQRGSGAQARGKGQLAAQGRQGRGSGAQARGKGQPAAQGRQQGGAKAQHKGRCGCARCRAAGGHLAGCNCARCRRDRVLVGRFFDDALPLGVAVQAGGDSELVRWVQSTLNRVLSLRLPVDGVMSPAVRSAVRDFQRREGLPEDGIVGPPTEQALARAAGGAAKNGGAQNGGAPTAQNGEEPAGQDGGAPAPQDGGEPTGGDQELYGEEAFIGSLWDRLRSSMGGSGSGSSAPAQPAYAPSAPRPSYVPSAPSAGPASGAAALRSNMAAVARKEWARWGKGTLKEGDPSIRSVLAGYWNNGVGWLPSGSTWWSSTPWSAAFISWVVKQAGGGSAFNYSASHAAYTAAARQNKLAGNSNPFKAYRTSEAVPRVGDIVCRDRGSGATYDNVREGMSTHCDIVVEVQPGKLTAIGGNLSDSVRTTSVTTDAQGRISQSGYFAVIRVGN